VPDAPAIVAVDVEKTFGATRAVAGASLRVDRGQLVALLGPSGSGKTSLLRLVAGFEMPDAGAIAIGGHDVAGPDVWVEPEHRRVGMVFQDGALFPHLTVAKNVGFGDATPERVRECLELVGLEHRGRAYPHELSGGERQRVALARALAPEPEVILLDEPFASLDTSLRIALREHVAEILRAAHASALLVTHDQQEALSLADVVVVMRAGRVEQAGTPEAVYHRPASRWMAEFLGEADVLTGVAGSTAGAVVCELGTLLTDRDARGDVDVVIRPDAVRTLAPQPATVTARVVGSTFLGHEQVTRLRLPSGAELRSRSSGATAWQVGDEVTVVVDGPVATFACERDGAPA
jgi:iron(III) transport system ATP-binding protein